MFVVLLSLWLMGNIKSVLREMYPGRDRYTEAEMDAARRVMMVAALRSDRSQRLPSIFIEVGGEYTYCGERFRCVKRPRVSPRDACRGCSFNKKRYSCPAALQCSKFDRRDGLFVWFVEIS